MKTQGIKERDIQLATIDHLRVRGKPGIVYWHTPNGGTRNRLEAARMQKEGVLAGIPDVLVLFEGQLYGLELKIKGGRVSRSQEYVLDLLEAQGAKCQIAHGMDAAIRALEDWGLVT